MFRNIHQPKLFIFWDDETAIYQCTIPGGGHAAAAATRAAATAFTEQLKARGAKYWQKVAKQEAKAARKSAQND